MTFSYIKKSRGFTAITVLSCLLSLNQYVNAETYKKSRIMPNAKTSLLLDVEKTEQKLIAVGERGHLLISSDDGASWEQSVVPIAEMLTAVDFVDEKNGWAVGHDGHIIHTADGGKTWNLQRDGLKAQAEKNISLMNESKSLVQQLKKQKEELQQLLETGADTSAYPTLPELETEIEDAEWDLEKAQERINEKKQAPPLMDVWFETQQHGWAVGAFGNLVETVDGGITWIDRAPDIGNTQQFHLNAVTGIASGYVILAGEAGFIVYSEDSGQTWQQADIGYDGSIFGLALSAKNSHIIATGLRGNTFKTTDLGKSWVRLNPGVDYSLSGGVYIEDSVVLVGTSGKIAVSEDGGENFKQYTLPSRSSLSSIVALKERGKYLIVGQNGVHHFDESLAK